MEVFLEVDLTVITSGSLGVVGSCFIHLTEVVAIVMVHERIELNTKESVIDACTDHLA